MVRADYIDIDGWIHQIHTHSPSDTVEPDIEGNSELVLDMLRNVQPRKLDNELTGQVAIKLLLSVVT